jgi:hypothetical protein
MQILEEMIPSVLQAIEYVSTKLIEILKALLCRLRKFDNKVDKKMES